MESTISKPELSALNRAVEIKGGVTALAKALGLKSHAVIQQWRINQVPAERCPAIEEVTGGKVRCEDLRPDVRWDVLRANPAPALVNTAQTATETVAQGA